MSRPGGEECTRQALRWQCGGINRQYGWEAGRMLNGWLRGNAQTAAQQLNVPITHCVVVGDSVWDMLAARRALALGVGLLSGGYGRDELERAGAYRVYDDPADLLRHLDEVGVRLESTT